MEGRKSFPDKNSLRDAQGLSSSEVSVALDFLVYGQGRVHYRLRELLYADQMCHMPVLTRPPLLPQSCT